jgi:hypothetical protein
MGNLEWVAMGSALGCGQQQRIGFGAAGVRARLQCDKPIRSRYIDAF